MELIPAIDIRNGRCVRLLYGDFDQETRYELDPRKLAREYRDAGARWLHIVDLDGAESGRRKNAALIREIAAASDLNVQLGGGIRDETSLEEALECADRAVIGSLAVTAPDTVSRWLEQYGAERIVLGLDVKLGADGTARIATHGWTEASELSLDAAIERYIPAGLVHVLCTDIARDGAMTGPNVALYGGVVARWPQIVLQASGGVSRLADLEALAAIGVPAAISGKALLEKKILLEEVASFLPNA
ncbi:MAG TPA: 1-(5-phosphoribosyl)-5-[(5-phosphoribosylamino)methylideneamino]imidazole-4-carboxamide isomerase [Gammaproteobacteria bacterium]|jgi:phosphoribosylformimino-5-aminoimidazole carboxamide ribotide isomerase